MRLSEAEAVIQQREYVQRLLDRISEVTIEAESIGEGYEFALAYVVGAAGLPLSYVEKVDNLYNDRLGGAFRGVIAEAREEQHRVETDAQQIERLSRRRDGAAFCRKCGYLVAAHAGGKPCGYVSNP